MSADSPITKFAQRVRAASNRGSKDVVLTLAEAIELSTSLVALQAKENKLLEDIVELQRRALDGPTQIEMDGGSFGPKD